MKISTKKYVDNQIKWEGMLREAEVKAIRQAVEKVEINYAQYREQQNNWRAAIKDQSISFVTRRELWGAVVTIITILLAATALIYKK